MFLFDRRNVAIFPVKLFLYFIRIYTYVVYYVEVLYFLSSPFFIYIWICLRISIDLLNAIERLIFFVYFIVITVLHVKRLNRIKQ